ncbi:MAG TPA: dihydrolipoamide acetyltransferase family protein [Bacteroidales bacterium]|nr:dihydrolipoamide acetyltransferase family protein [Bacteroidales bacterium]
MAATIIMPRQGQSVETCIITQWLKRKGDPVKAGDILFSYETDKASFDVEAPESGVLLDIFFDDGAEVPVLSVVAVIGNPEDERPVSVADLSASPESHPERSRRVFDTENASTPASTLLSMTSGTDPCAGLRISPRARNMAQKLGIDINSVTGTGPNGRIIARDIEAASSQTKMTVSDRPSQEYSDTALSNVRKIIARTMHDSISNSAQLTHHMSADVRNILALRNRFKQEGDKSPNASITINDMVCFAVIRALNEHPAINAHFMGDKIRYFNRIHLGLAVDTPRGLMVPALQDAGNLSLADLSKALRDMATLCRKGSINPELLSGSAASFTVSNLGNYGVEMFTPIINPPQVAILGVNTIIHRPADLGNGVFGFIPVIGLSLTYDHRAIDGGPATLFLKEIKDQIENFKEF